MASNFWTSSHARLLVPKEVLAQCHARDCSAGVTLAQILDLKAFFVQLVFDLTKACKLRQRVACTAAVYFRRFYARNDFCEHEPPQIACASLYVASKAEETMVATKHLVAHAHRLYPLLCKRLDVPTLLDQEMLLIQELGYDLVVFSPFRSLAQFLPACGHPALAQDSWAILNDSYRGEVALVWPPYMIALAALHLAAVRADADIAPWLHTLSVDFNQVYDASEDLLSLYEQMPQRGVRTVADVLGLLERVRT